MAAAKQWLMFPLLPPSPNRTTNQWEVKTVQGTLLGLISWYGPWRAYAFFPKTGTVYERTCLREIAEFCDTRTRWRREAAKERARSTFSGRTP